MEIEQEMLNTQWKLLEDEDGNATATLLPMLDDDQIDSVWGDLKDEEGNVVDPERIKQIINHTIADGEGTRPGHSNFFNEIADGLNDTDSLSEFEVEHTFTPYEVAQVVGDPRYNFSGNMHQMDISRMGDWDEDLMEWSFYRTY